MKIFSVRFYKGGIVVGEVIVSNDKELKRIVKVPKIVRKLKIWARNLTMLDYCLF
jgi:hypothetical protein